MPRMNPNVPGNANIKNVKPPGTVGKSQLPVGTKKLSGTPAAPKKK